jgi:hypothetical protein
MLVPMHSICEHLIASNKTNSLNHFRGEVGLYDLVDIGDRFDIRGEVDVLVHG